MKNHQRKFAWWEFRRTASDDKLKINWSLCISCSLCLPSFLSEEEGRPQRRNRSRRRRNRGNHPEGGSTSCDRQPSERVGRGQDGGAKLTGRDHRERNVKLNIIKTFKAIFLCYSALVESDRKLLLRERRDWVGLLLTRFKLAKH